MFKFIKKKISDKKIPTLQINYNLNKINYNNK